jgi:hypothetical protein
VGATLQLGLVALIALLLGALGAYLFPNVAARLSTHRARRRFVQFVQPERAGGALPPLSDAKIEGVGFLIHQVLRQQENDCEEKSVAQLPRLGAKAPLCHEMTARVLALLEALSSCAWGCAMGELVLVRLV